MATLKHRQRRGGGRGATVPVAAGGAVDLFHRGLAKPETRRGSAGDWSPPAGDGRSRADDPAGTDGEPKVACSVLLLTEGGKKNQSGHGLVRSSE